MTGTMSGQPITLRVVLTFEHVSGPALDGPNLFDLFAARYGARNGAQFPLELTATDGWTDEPASVYRLELVDDTAEVIS